MFPLRMLLRAGAVVAVALPIVGGLGPPTSIGRAPYVQLGTPESVVIVWRTIGPIDPVVRFGDSPELLDFEIYEEDIDLRLSPDLEDEPDLPRLHSAPAETYQYEAHVPDLEPGTRYYYAVCNGDEVLAGGDARHFFDTAPAAERDRPTRLWVVGDSGTGGPDQRRVYAALQQQEGGPQGRLVDLFLHVGDMAYNDGRDDEFQRGFFDVYADLLCNTVCWPTMGNHEGHTSRGETATGPYYDAYVVPEEGEAGGVPSGTEAYYSFDYGDIHFICLNSYDLDRRPTAEMAAWLRQDLTEVDARWCIAFWHHPPYSRGTHDSDREVELVEMRRYIMPILEDHGVDLVMAGHSHIYERSMLIDGAYATPTVAEGVILDDGDGNPDGDGPYRKPEGLQPHQGTLAIVTGHGGAGVGRRGTMPIMRSIEVDHGSLLLDIQGDTLDGRMLDHRGEVRDRFRLVKTGAGRATPVQNPWQPWGPRIDMEIGAAGSRALLQPRPAAPDAVVHYTLDGSEPTAASEVYTGPVELAATTTVRAISRWKSGQRQSPVEERRLIDYPAGTILLPVTASADDAEEDGFGRVQLSSSGLDLVQEEGPLRVGLRFDSVDVRGPDVVRSAHLQFTAAVGAAGETTVEIRGVMQPDPRPFLAQAGGVSGRPLTEAVVTWSPPAWRSVADRGKEQATPDLSPLLRELMAQPGWQSGQAIAFVLQGSGRRIAASFDGAPEFAPVLVLETSGAAKQGGR